MSSPKLHIPLFKDGFVDLFKSKQFSDVEVAVNGKVYACHRLILASISSFFKKELEKDSKAKQITVTCDPKFDMDIVLRYAYEGTRANLITTGNCVSLYLAAEFFGMPSLTRGVNSFVKQKVNSTEILYYLIGETSSASASANVFPLLQSLTAYAAAHVEQLAESLRKNILGFPQDVFFALVDAIGEHNSKNLLESKKKAASDLVNDFLSLHADSFHEKTFLQKVVKHLFDARLLLFETAMKALPQCEQLDLKVEAAQCAQVLAQNFITLLENKQWLKSMKPSSVISLLSSDELFVKSEDVVLDVSLEYVACHEDSLTPEQIRSIMECIRYSFLSANRLKQMKENPPKYIPQEEIVEALLLRLSKMEGGEAANSAASHNVGKKFQQRKNRVFVYEKDFDLNGILYWLGTLQGTEKYQNPHLRGYLTVTANANNEVGKPYDSICHAAAKCNFVNKVGTVVTIKLHQIEVQPSYYSLRHTLSRDTEALRNWKLQASKDGNTWVDLKIHSNDNSLTVKGSTKSWQLDFASEYYQYFRVSMTGNNSSNNNYLSMGGFELYGLVKDLPHQLCSEIKPNPV